MKLTRVNIAADGKLVEELEREAKKRGYTLYAVTNIALKAITKILKEGEDVSSLESLVEFYLMAKALDLVPVTSWFLDNLSRIAYEGSQDKYSEICKSAGKQLALYLKTRANSLEEVLVLYNLMKPILPINEIVVKKKENDEIEMRITGTGFSLESTLCAKDVVVNVMESYGFKILSAIPSPGGVIVLIAKYQGQPSK
jgi:hypothetical protein